MGRYQRNYGYSGSQKTKVTLIWDNNIGVYALKFHDTRHWDKIQGILTWVKQTWIWSDRDYDPTDKVWFLKDQHIKELCMVCRAIPEFEFVFSEKPENAPTITYTSNQTYADTFKKITGHQIDLTLSNIAGSDAYDVAKKAYRKACLRLHPDRNPNDDSCAMLMSSLNEAWTNLEIRHFKIREVMQQEA